MNDDDGRGKFDSTGLAHRLQHIAICGNIGSGKTTLTLKLAKHYGWTPLTESVDDNPYLEDFYADMKKWAFHVQVYFLSSRFSQISQIREKPGVTVQDRTLYEDAYVFAANLHESGLMSSRDYQCYLQIFNSMHRSVKPPELLIYLKADVPKLMRQIEKRGRDYEKAISPEYLANLNRRYNTWIANYRPGLLLEIEVNHLDFENEEADFKSIVHAVDRVLRNETSW